MSLINDALKRAEADKPRLANSTPSAPPLQPVDSTPAPRTSPLLLGGVLLLGIGAIGIAAALWFKESATLPVSAKATPATIATPPPAQSPQVPALPVSQTTPGAPTQNPIQHAAAQLQAVAARNEVDPVKAQPPTPQTQVPTTKTPAITTVASASITAGSASKSPPSANHTANTGAKPIRLQSIFYRLKSPTVIINGKTLAPGDSVDGIKVVSIQRTSVEVVQNGKYRTLTLQD